MGIIIGFMVNVVEFMGGIVDKLSEVENKY